MRIQPPLELICWTTALILLSAADVHGSHFSLCPLASMGITWCPGCGLGRSIVSFLHGDIQASFRFHWLGIPALCILLVRMVSLIKNTYIHITLIKNNGSEFINEHEGHEP